MSQYQAGTLTTMMTTELNSLATGSGVTQATGTNAAYDNSAAGAGYFWADFELAVTFGTNPTADATVELYVNSAPDGTNYGRTADGASPEVNLGDLVGTFTVKATTSAQRPKLRGVPLPPTPLKLYAINRSGQAFPASGTVVKMLPYRTQ